MKKYIFLLLLIPTICLTADRSPQWEHVRKEFLKIQPICQVCGTSKSLQVHHIVPFHKNPKLELDITNLVTLCTSKYPGFNCHNCVGHGSNFRWENPWVREDIVVVRALILKYKGYTTLPKEIEDYLTFIKQRTKEYNKK